MFNTWRFRNRERERERDLLAIDLGGWSLQPYLVVFEFSALNKTTEPLQSLILSQSGIYSNNLRNIQLSLKSEIRHLKSSKSLSAKADL